VSWAQTIGPSAAALVTHILQTYPHPEDGYRKCMALIRTSKKYGPARVDAACRRAIAIGSPNRKSVEMILKRGLENAPVPTPSDEPQLTLHHENVRGSTYLKLHAMADAVRELLTTAPGSAMSFEEKLGLVVEREWTDRENRRLARRLKDAKLGTNACLEDVWCEPARGLDKDVVRSLATCQWVRAKQNVIAIGATGVGKSFLKTSGNSGGGAGNRTLKDGISQHGDAAGLLSVGFENPLPFGWSVSPRGSRSVPPNRPSSWRDFGDTLGTSRGTSAAAIRAARGSTTRPRLRSDDDCCGPHSDGKRRGPFVDR
jgi:hypothetical protein